MSTTLPTPGATSPAATGAHPGPSLPLPDAAAATDLLGAVERFSRTLREAAASISRTAGCPKSTFLVVRILRKRGQLQVSELANLLRVDLSVASRQVSLLVDEGLVERTVDEADRRARSIRLTPAGEARAAELEAVMVAHVAQRFAGWTADDVRAAAATLDRITQTLALPPPASD